MKTVEIEEELPYSIEEVWAIFADVTRSDWSAVLCGKDTDAFRASPCHDTTIGERGWLSL